MIRQLVYGNEQGTRLIVPPSKISNNGGKNMQTRSNNDDISFHTHNYPLPIQKGIYSLFIKRPLDFVLSFTALIILSPLFLLIAIIIKSKLGSPVIFKQKRPGLNGQAFNIYKFRTMTDNRDDNGDLLPDNVRLTSFGRFLRSTSLDELPELINILKGDMSIVGPRPLLEEYLPYYSENELLRHSVRPGLSGLAQISGRNYLKWEDRLSKDIEYVVKISFIGDLKIIYTTLLNILNKSEVAVDTSLVEGNLAVIRQRQLAEHEAAVTEAKT